MHCSDTTRLGHSSSCASAKEYGLPTAASIKAAASANSFCYVTGVSAGNPGPSGSGVRNSPAKKKYANVGDLFATEV